MVRRPSLYQVAEKAGVSTATVSYSFNRPDRVRTETREMVLRVADELGYIPSANARGLARGSTDVLGLYAFDMLLDDAGDRARPDPSVFPLYIDEIQRGFQLECWKSGRSVLVSSSPREDGAGITDLAGRVDGLAAFPGTAPEATIERIAHHVPVVLFNQPVLTGDTYSVAIDNYTGIKFLVDHLIDAHGITDLGFVGSLNLEHRFELFCQAVAARGLPAPSAPFISVDVAASELLERMQELLRHKRPPRAIVCGQDQIAIAVMGILQREGYRVPEDVAITGFDGILAGELSSPTLTTARQPMEEMGRMAVRFLLDQPTEPEERTRVFLPQLIVRQSCGCR